MKFTSAACLLLTGITAFFNIHCDTPTQTRKPEIIDAVPKDAPELRLKHFALLAKQFIAKNKFNPSFCFLIDMKQPSGKKRFFIYSLTGDSIMNGGLVTHGSGSKALTGELRFSNRPNSNATSLGKYMIGQKYQGKFGLAFKLYGLDTSNSNAYARNVVLHAHPYVPAYEVYPSSICVSWGCPTVNPVFLKTLEHTIDHSGKPVLLYIFY